ncbi:MAG: site-specific DNA-methyltransferase [Dehalococcoidales bacterium]|nr:site-specific DNA-methyltransferase [Dehalococcoidales bacterium]
MPKNLLYEICNLPVQICDTYSPNSNIVLHCGLTQDFLQSLPESSIDLIITSPPYNLGKEYETKTSIEEYLETQRNVLVQLVRVLKNTGSICWQVGNYVCDGELFPLDIFYYKILKELGLILRNRIIWRFGHGLHASKRFSGRYETILWFTKTNSYLFNLNEVRIPAKYPGKLHSKGPNKGKPSGNPKGKNPSDVWDIIAEDWESGVWEIPNVKAKHCEKTIHPCQFPVELAERCILALTIEGSSVFDPYAGVGSSLIAAIKHNRQAIGSEKERKYVDIAQKRIENLFSGNLPIRSLGKPLHQPQKAEKVSQVPIDWIRDKETIYYGNINDINV